MVLNQLRKADETWSPESLQQTWRLGELIQERFRLLEITGFESLDKPLHHRRQDLIPLRPSPALLQEVSQTRGGT